MRTGLLFLLYCLAYGANACPSMEETVAHISNGDTASLEEAVSCGFDLHREGDKALHIAIRAGSAQSEAWLRAHGLRSNARFLRNLWFADFFALSALKSQFALYKLQHPEVHLRPDNADTVMEEFFSLQVSDHLTDKWQRHYTYQVTGSGTSTSVVFCTLGRDGMHGGELYNRDICTTDTSEALADELIQIGYF